MRAGHVPVVVSVSGHVSCLRSVRPRRVRVARAVAGGRCALSRPSRAASMVAEPRSSLHSCSSLSGGRVRRVASAVRGRNRTMPATAGDPRDARDGFRLLQSTLALPLLVTCFANLGCFRHDSPGHPLCSRPEPPFSTDKADALQRTREKSLPLLSERIRVPFLAAAVQQICVDERRRAHLHHHVGLLGL